MSVSTRRLLMDAELEARLMSAVRSHPAVRRVELVGSRAEGRRRATEHSDWDFEVETDDFEAVAAALPDLLAPLQPVAQQWDRLSTHRCWMAILPGAVKVDLIFGAVAHEPEPAWVPAADNLAAIDRHFWDWTLWLSGKDAAGKDDVVGDELQKLFDHLLGPLGVEQRPSSVGEAVAAYRAARAQAEDRFERVISRRLEGEVAPVLDA